MSIIVRSLFVLLLLALPARAAADTYHIFYSLEAHIAEAEWVFHGSIAELSREVVPQGNFSKDVVKYTVTVAVDKVLKGKPPERIQLVRGTDALDRRFEQWQEAKTGFLWCVGPGKDTDFWLGGPPRLKWRTIRLGDPVPAEADYGVHAMTSFAPPIFTTDLSVLRDPAEILIRARDFARKHSDASEVQQITLPRTLEGHCAPKCHGVMILPIAPPLEETARRMIDAPEQFIPGGGPLDARTRYDVRTAGIECLRHFKSDANIAILKRLLDDPTEDPRNVYAPLGRPIRSRARYELEDWGVDVPVPE